MNLCVTIAYRSELLKSTRSNHLQRRLQRTWRNPFCLFSSREAGPLLGSLTIYGQAYGISGARVQRHGANHSTLEQVYAVSNSVRGFPKRTVSKQATCPLERCVGLYRTSSASSFQRHFL